MKRLLKLFHYHVGVIVNRPIGGYDHYCKQCKCGKMKGDFSSTWVSESEYYLRMNKMSEQ